MATITNMHRGNIGLPNGQILPPRTPTEVLGWEQIKQNKGVARWVDRGVLIVEGELKKVPVKPAVPSPASPPASPPAAPQPLTEAEEAAVKQQLIEKLKALGVKDASKRNSIETLREKLETAEKKANK